MAQTIAKSENRAKDYGKQAKSKMKVTGKSVFTIQAATVKRAQEQNKVRSNHKERRKSRRK